VAQLKPASDQTPALAASATTQDELILERIKKDIFYLAGEECQGRGLKTEGIKKAGEYIAQSFKNSGLLPGGPEKSYFQPFTVQQGGQVQPGAKFAVTGPKDISLELKVGTDFQATVASQSGKSSAGLVFIGYGVQAPDQKYDDFDGIDVKGKWLMVLRRTPRADDKAKPFDPNNQHAPLLAKITKAAERGASGVIFISDRGTAGKNDLLMEPNRTQGASIAGPVVQIKRSIVDQILKNFDKSLDAIETEIDKTGKPQSFELKGWQASADITVKRIEFPTRNVIGVLEGNGPLKDETIVIGAHYDHLGKGDEGNSLDRQPTGKVHYGADDNASGTTGLLELARRFGAIKDRQGRRIVFIAFSGEEKGLLGSQHYVRNPTFPIEKTIFMLNMDMIGRMAEVEGKDKVKRDRVVIYGTGTSPDMEKLVDDFVKPFNYHLFKIEGGSGPSDHTSFYAKKIPVLFLFTGTHVDYHKPTDTPDRINLKGLKKIVDTAELFAEHFAKVEKRPEYRATRGGSEDPTRPGGRTTVSVPRLGIMPGNYGEADGGVLVEVVSEDGPAKKAGMKEGDRIVEINGKAVKNIETYMSVMGQQKPQVEIPIVVIREDKKVTVKVTPLPAR
jgi:hypothetical protein